MRQDILHRMASELAFLRTHVLECEAETTETARDVPQRLIVNSTSHLLDRNLLQDQGVSHANTRTCKIVNVDC